MVNWCRHLAAEPAHAYDEDPRGAQPLLGVQAPQPEGGGCRVQMRNLSRGVAWRGVDMQVSRGGEVQRYRGVKVQVIRDAGEQRCKGAKVQVSRGAKEQRCR